MYSSITINETDRGAEHGTLDVCVNFLLFFVYSSFAIFLGILVLTFSNLSIIFDGAKKVTSYHAMKARDRSRKGVTRQQMKRPLCRYGWERRYLRKCNFLDGMGGGGRKRLAPSPEPLRTAFCATGRN